MAAKIHYQRMTQIMPHSVSASSQPISNLFSWTLPALMIIGLIAFAQINYLLFHTLAELICIVIGIMITMAAWHTRHLVQNRMILALGCGYFWVSILDLAHMTSYKGMGIFSHSGTNLATQLWLSARLVEALVLLTALALAGRRYSCTLFFVALGIVSAFMLTIATYELMPVAYSDAEGLTSFKIYSEFVIIALLLLAAFPLRANKEEIPRDLYRYMPAIIALTIFSELCFTKYTDVYDWMNMSGHLLKTLSFWLLFLATVRITLERPFAQMARDASTYDAVPYATVIVDMNNTIQQANMATCTMLGKPRHEIIGQNAHQLFHHPHQNAWQCINCQAINLITPTLYQQVERKNGTWYEVSNYPISNGHSNTGAVQVIQDISDKMASEASNIRLHTLVEQAPSLIAICTPEGQIEYLNAAGQELMRTAENTEDTTFNIFSRLSHFSLQQTLNDIIQRSQLLGNASDECEIINFDGQRIPILLTLIAHHNHQYKIDYFSIIAHDISLQKQQEKIVRHAQKMESLGQLTSGIAHDFNNILSVIMGYSQLLNRKLFGQEHLQSFNNEIYRASERASRLTSQLLAFSRKIDGQQQPENLNLIIENMRPMMAQTLGRHIIIQTNLANDLWQVTLNRSEFEDALLNLAINAMHAMPQGGELSISSNNIDTTKPDSRITGMEPGSYTHISISDNGCGIDEQILPKIFEPFFTTKESRGSGLGLSQVFGFMKRCHGHIFAQSALGQGSTFHLYFPRSHSMLPEPSSSPNRDENHVSEHHENILVVDPDPSVCRLIKRILNHDDYRVLIASSSSQAKLLIDANTFQLMICDLVIPSDDALGLAGYFQKKTKNASVILLAGHQKRERGTMSGHADNLFVLSKPFSPKILLNMVRYAIKNSHSKNSEIGST